MQDLHIKRENLINQLNQAIAIKKRRGILKAKAERRYRVALKQEELRLRAMEGKAKIPSNMIGDVARGNEKVANLKMHRDIAESHYDTVQEKIMAIKLEIRIVENEIEAIRNCK